MKSNKPDIALISETNVARRNNIDVVGYKTFRQDKSQSRRGTAIFLRDNISYSTSEVLIPGLYTSEATAVRIELGQGESLTIISIYFKCGSTNENIRNDMGILNNVLKRTTYGLIGGDFNARHHQWQDTTISIEGKAIVDWLDDHGEEHSLVVVSQPKPTFPRTPSTLDFFLSTSNFVFVIPDICNFTCSTVPSDSDHEAVLLSIKLSQPAILAARPQADFIDYKRLNFERLQLDIEGNLVLPPANRNLQDNEIDQVVESMESTISIALDAQKIHRTTKDRYQHLPEYVQHLYSHRQRLRKRLQRIHQRELNRVNPEYRAIKSELECVNIMFRNSIRHHNDISFKKRLREIKPGPNAFKEINRLIGRRKPLPEVLMSNNIELSSMNDKVEAFANQFEQSFTPKPSTDQAFLNEVETSIQLTQQPNTQAVQFNDTCTADDPANIHKFCNPEEIAEIISNLKPKKSTGMDGISNYVLKRLPQVFMIILAIIINNCINNGYFPKKWKTAKIVAIPKKGSTNMISNYRPVSLLNNISKILEEVVLRRLKKFCNEHNIIPDMQFGFRQAHSTIHPLLKFQCDVTAALNSHRATVGCFLDVEKAFDSVWIEALIHKLRLFNIPQPIIKIFFSFLSFRNFFVEIDSCKSTIRDVKAGVAQGSKLGPFLYSLMTSDQPLPTDCENLLFADDSLTYSSSMFPTIAARRVEAHTSRLYEYYQKWGIRINTSKSELVCFRRPVTNNSRCRSAAVARNLVLTFPDGSRIKAKKNAKYLGVHFNELLRFNPHSKAVITKANIAFHRVHPLLKKKTGLSKPTKLLIYKQLLRPVITYSFPIWFTISKTAMEKLKVFERKILRICTDLQFDRQRQKHYSNRRVYEEAEIKPLDHFLAHTARKIITNVASHPNQLMRRMTNQERHPDPRYLSGMDILDKFPTDDDDDVSFYAGLESAYYRG